LDLTDGNEADGTLLQVWSCPPDNPDSNQKWLLSGGQIIHRTLSGHDYCVDIPSNDRTDGKRLQVWSCAGTPQQQFSQQAGSLKTPDGSKCLDLKDGALGNGVAVQLWDCDSGNENQQWIVTNITGFLDVVSV